MYKFKAGDKVRRIAESTAEVKKGGIYTVVKELYPNLYLQDVISPHDSFNFELVEDTVRSSLVQEVITAWLDKLTYVLSRDDTVSDYLDLRVAGLTLESDVVNIVGSADIYQYVENTYDQLKSQEIQKKSQKLLEQKEQLTKQLADIEKELGSLK